MIILIFDFCLVVCEELQYKFIEAGDRVPFLE